jgi:hypothetical protein
MDRLNRETSESIIDKGPLMLGGEPPKGYGCIRTTIEIRDIRTQQGPEADNDFRLGAVINTEVRKGTRWAVWSRETELKVVQDHREVTALLLQAVRDAKEPPNRPAQ